MVNPAPPINVGAVNVTVACALPPVADPIVGALGAAGLTVTVTVDEAVTKVESVAV
jgi:hypothetical protein